MTSGTKLAHRALGTGGLSVSAIGLGLMSLSGVYGTADDAQSEALIRYAIDQGGRSSDPPICMAGGTMRSCSDARSRGGGIRSCWRPSSARCSVRARATA